MPKIALIVGAESTGSRLFTTILSQHPLILGTPDAEEHEDILDEMWEYLEAGNIETALACLPDLQGVEYLLTRRVIPHGRPGVDASPNDIPNLWGLYVLTRRAGLGLVLLVNSRSPAANLASWTLTRASAGGSPETAQWMYRRAYRYIFGFLNCYKQVPYLLLSLEALLLDGHTYVQSLFRLLGLPPYQVEMDLETEVNLKRYEWYSEEGESIV